MVYLNIWNVDFCFLVVWKLVNSCFLSEKSQIDSGSLPQLLESQTKIQMRGLQKNWRKKRLEMAKLNILHQVKISNWLNLTFVCNHCHECKAMNAERGDFDLKSELRSPKSAHHVPWKKLARFDWRVLLHCVVYWFRSCFSKRPDYEIYYKWSFNHLI